MYLSTLSSTELMNVADHALDPLLSTDLERELLKRFEGFIGIEEDYEKLEEYAHNLDTAGDDAVAAFPEDEFLDGVQDRLAELAEKLSGEDKEEAEAIVNLLTRIQEEVAEQKASVERDFERANADYTKK